MPCEMRKKKEIFKLLKEYLSYCLVFLVVIMHSELFGKVVVASKVPLPNYRPDLDDKRPQREVITWLRLWVENFNLY